VVFAHGSGSSRFSPRNAYVARFLYDRGLATLLFDLLTREEDMVYANRFNIELLAQRLRGATEWARAQPELSGKPIGYFGSSTGAAAALRAAADDPEIYAVVSRGGRPDLVIPHLPKVRAPTLLIVGGLDTIVLALNQEAMKHLKCEKELAVVPGASHLFEEPGKLEEVARLAADWFVKHLP
jgi:dienelactone hydrolase